MDQKLRESGPVLFNRQIAEGIYHLSVQAPRIAAASRPGQFVQVKVASEPPVQFLRMPFAVFDVDESAGSVDVCYQVVGEGTEQLSHVCSPAVAWVPRRSSCSPTSLLRKARKSMSSSARRR